MKDKVMRNLKGSVLSIVSFLALLVATGSLMLYLDNHISSYYANFTQPVIMILYYVIMMFILGYKDDLKNELKFDLNLKNILISIASIAAIIITYMFASTERQVNYEGIAISGADLSEILLYTLRGVGLFFAVNVTFKKVLVDKYNGSKILYCILVMIAFGAFYRNPSIAFDEEIIGVVTFILYGIYGLIPSYLYLSSGSYGLPALIQIISQILIKVFITL